MAVAWEPAVGIPELEVEAGMDFARRSERTFDSEISGWLFLSRCYRSKLM